MKKKVLIINIIRFSRYGIGAVIKNYCWRLKEHYEFDFLLCAGAEQENFDFIKQIGGRALTLRCSRNKQPISYVVQLTKLIKKNKYDIVHVHGNSATMFFDIHAAKKAGVPMRIAHSHSSSGKYKMLHYVLKKPLSKEMTVGVACSEQAGRWAFEREFVVLNNAIETEKFSFNTSLRDELREKYNLEDKFVLLNVGRLNRLKNQWFLLELLQSLSGSREDMVLVLIGDGEYEESLKIQAEKLKVTDKVLFLGKRDNIHDFYNIADMFVFPSEYEGFGLVLVEAQASGLVCVASTGVPVETNICDKVTYINVSDYMGWKNKLEEADRISDKSRMISSQNAIVKLKQNGYDVKLNAERLMNIYENN